MDNPEAQKDSTQLDDSNAMEQSQTEEALLADIIRNSDFVDTLPDEQVPQLDAEDTDEEDPKSSEEADNVDEEEEVETEEEETTDADDESTQEADVYTADDLDLEAQVLVKIDGEDVAVSFSDLIKGYSTEQHLSNEGRKLGDARKEMEVEYNGKVQELSNMAKASATMLYSAEEQLSKEYHDLEGKINTAREEGDTYQVNELKDQREQVQKQYWNARNQREGMVDAVQKQAEEQTAKAWQEQLKHFQETIPTMSPDCNEETALAIREFAEEKGIPSELLDTVADPVLIKFVDDFRRLEQGVSTGKAKRKATSVKKAPLRKARTKSQKQVDANEALRQRALSGEGSEEDQKAFLRNMAERSLNI